MLQSDLDRLYDLYSYWADLADADPYGPNYDHDRACALSVLAQIGQILNSPQVLTSEVM